MPNDMSVLIFLFHLASEQFYSVALASFPLSEAIHSGTHDSYRVQKPQSLVATTPETQTCNPFELSGKTLP